MNRLSATGVAGAILVALFLLSSPVQAAQLLMFHEEGCPWCQAWEHQIGTIYDKTDEAKVLPLTRLDVHEDLPADLELKSPVNFTPTFVVIQDNKEVGRIPGYPGDEFFWFLLAELIEKIPE
ncbi:hypothetical protein [Magnetospira sp. QH-2]|uniref:hypothetical protein n=1 Tax=Magnetospira sp. (strain QH-2) TaxID=1288970 RepID=UPI0003E81262|nr:hypothetical protein [Magnetospira sp. QH-2]CCQ73764.1 Putative thioredoxin; putative SoxS protein [Magnetospira sp. QH-2]